MPQEGQGGCFLEPIPSVHPTKARLGGCQQGEADISLGSLKFPLKLS